MFRPDLDDEIFDLEQFINSDSLNAEQVNMLQDILLIDLKAFKIPQVNQLLNKLLFSFQETDQKCNWKILKIIVYILKNDETFKSFYNPSIFEIAMNFLQNSSDENCLIQSLFLLNIITERTEFRVLYEKMMFLLSLFQYDFSFTDYKQLVLNILRYHINVETPEEIIHEIYEKAKILLTNQTFNNRNLSVESFSLQLISEILQKCNVSISNDDVELYYSYANSKYVNIAIDGLKLFNSYAQNQNNMNQIIEYNLIDHLLHISLFQNHKVSQHAFFIFETISEHGELGSKTVYDNLTISNFLSYSFSIQISILRIIYNFTKYKIINELLQVSSDAFEFVLIFLESDVEDCLLLSLNIILNLLPSLTMLLNKEIIVTLESLALHYNEQISSISKSILDYAKSK